MKDYEIYQADEDDITYTQDYYQQEDKTLMMFKSKMVVSPELLDEQGIKAQDRRYFDEEIKKNMHRNSTGQIKIDKKVPGLRTEEF